MNKVKLKNLEMIYTSGAYAYNQGIKGRYNYQHSYRNKVYNGCGGEQVFTPSKLNLYGVTNNDTEVIIPIKNDILEHLIEKKYLKNF